MTSGFRIAAIVIPPDGVRFVGPDEIIPAGSPVALRNKLTRALDDIAQEVVDARIKSGHDDKEGGAA